MRLDPSIVATMRPRPKGGAVHHSWPPLLSALRTAHVAPDLEPGSLQERVGTRRAWQPVNPTSFTALMASYFRGDGQPSEAVLRSRRARYIVHRESDTSSAREIVGRLRLAAPELGTLRLVDNKDADRLELHTVGVESSIPGSEVALELSKARDGMFCRRVVTVRALVIATNALLKRRGAPCRFVPLQGPEGIETYVGVEPIGAMILDSVNALDEPLDELCELASWSPDELSEVVARLRTVA